MSDYFEANAYKPKYEIGDRVFGKWNKVPFIGSVGNDRVVGINGPEITIHLDLPIRFEEKTHHVIIVKHKDVKRLTNFDEALPKGKK